MGQVLTNNTGLAYARESSLGVLPGSPEWKTVEPNDTPSLGAELTSVSRSPISKLRQRRAGTVTDLDANAEIEADVTLDSLIDFTEAFVFANAVNRELTFRGANATSSGYTIPSATATQAGKIQFTTAGPITLFYAAGYALAANNGLKPATADVASTGTLITVAGNAAETAPTNAEVSVCGIRAQPGDLALAVSGNIGTLTSGNNSATPNVNFTTLGLTVGQTIHVGGMDSTKRFGSTADADGTRSYGAARIRTIAAGALTLDKLGPNLLASDGSDDGDGGTLIQVDILFGRFARNVSVDHADYAFISHHFEAELPNLYETEPPGPVANPDGFIYVKGAVANTMSWEMPLTDKSTATFAFVGINADEPVDNSARLPNAATARAPLFTEPFNTSADFFRLGIADVDDDGLTSDFTEMTVEINNNVAPEKVLGRLGARYMNNGNFELNVTGQVLFTNALIATRIRNNTTVTAAWMLKNGDGAVSVDVPSAKIKGGAISYPVNQTVPIEFDLEAFVDPLFGTSIGVSFFPVYPTDGKEVGL